MAKCSISPTSLRFCAKAGKCFLTQAVVTLVNLSLIVSKHLLSFCCTINKFGFLRKAMSMRDGRKRQRQTPKWFTDVYTVEVMQGLARVVLAKALSRPLLSYAEMIIYIVEIFLVPHRKFYGLMCHTMSSPTSTRYSYPTKDLVLLKISNLNPTIPVITFQSHSVHCFLSSNK